MPSQSSLQLVNVKNKKLFTQIHVQRMYVTSLEYCGNVYAQPFTRNLPRVEHESISVGPGNPSSLYSVTISQRQNATPFPIRAFESEVDHARSVGVFLFAHRKCPNYSF